MIATSPESTSVSWVEHQTLEHIKGALRVTVDWRAPAVSQARKKSSIRFALQSFCRHLERLMRIEEEGGYMAVVADQNPCLSHQIRRLAGDHDRFRARVAELTPRLEEVAEWQDDDFDGICEDIKRFLDEVDRHDFAEVELLQETLTLDEGGEG
ncbi:MAG: hemerythrin domain-containing protein [Planctomycetota bacterium]